MTTATNSLGGGYRLKNTEKINRRYLIGSEKRNDIEDCINSGAIGWDNGWYTIFIAENNDRILRFHGALAPGKNDKTIVLEYMGYMGN